MWVLLVPQRSCSAFAAGAVRHVAGTVFLGTQLLPALYRSLHQLCRRVFRNCGKILLPSARHGFRMHHATIVLLWTQLCRVIVAGDSGVKSPDYHGACAGRDRAIPFQTEVVGFSFIPGKAPRLRSPLARRQLTMPARAGSFTVFIPVGSK
jgi:hypothetical protein